jgi:GTP cyclohydrolase I
MNFNVNEDNIKTYVMERFIKKFHNINLEEATKSDLIYFNNIWDIYKSIPEFKINENIFENVEMISHHYKSELEAIQFIVRMVTTFYLTKAFEAMKIDLNDPNVAEDLESGNIGTPGRLAKMWCGADTHDDRELMGGRFHEPIRLAKFPNEISDKEFKNPIIKEVDLTAVCSHHLAPFGTLVSSNPNAKVIISYIPDKYVLGISKLQRVVRYIAQRGWLQEDLTKAIYNEISKTAETDSVYIKLKNIEHSCEKYRGAMTQGDGFTTEYFGGVFREDKDLLNSVRNY